MYLCIYIYVLHNNQGCVRNQNKLSHIVSKQACHGNLCPSMPESLF